VRGAMSEADAAIDRGVNKVTVLSTKKVANPASLYCATRLWLL